MKSYPFFIELVAKKFHTIEFKTIGCGLFRKKTRKNAIVEYLGYQIPVTQLYGDMQAAKRD